MSCSYTWLDNDLLVANVIPEGRPGPPPRPSAPIGPRIQDNSYGEKSQARTYQDLLKDDHDEDLFDYYSTCSLVSVKVKVSLPLPMYNDQVSLMQLYHCLTLSSLTERDDTEDGRMLNSTTVMFSQNASSHSQLKGFCTADIDWGNQTDRTSKDLHWSESFP